MIPSFRNKFTIFFKTKPLFGLVHRSVKTFSTEDINYNKEFFPDYHTQFLSTSQPKAKVKKSKLASKDAFLLLQNDLIKYDELKPKDQMELLSKTALYLKEVNDLEPSVNYKEKVRFLIDSSLKLSATLKGEIETSFLKNVISIAKDHSALSAQELSEWVVEIAKKQIGAHTTSLSATTDYCLIAEDLFRFAVQQNAAKTVQPILKNVLSLCKRQIEHISEFQKEQEWDMHYYLTKIIFVYIHLHYRDDAFLLNLYSTLIHSNVKSFEDIQFSAAITITHYMIRMNILDAKKVGFNSVIELLAMLEGHLVHFLKEQKIRPELIPFILYSFCKVKYEPKQSIDAIKRCAIGNLRSFTIQQISLLNISIQSIPSIDKDKKLLKAIIIDYFDDSNLNKLAMPDLYYCLFALREAYLKDPTPEEQLLFESYIKKLRAVFNQKIDQFNSGDRIRMIDELWRLKSLPFKTYKEEYSSRILQTDLQKLDNFEFLTLGAILKRYMMMGSKSIEFMSQYVQTFEKRKFSGFQEQLAHKTLSGIKLILENKIKDMGIRDPQALDVLERINQHLKGNAHGSEFDRKKQ